MEQLWLSLRLDSIYASTSNLLTSPFVFLIHKIERGGWGLAQAKAVGSIFQGFKQNADFPASHIPKHQAICTALEDDYGNRK